MDEKHEANRRRWNAASPSYAAMGDRLGNWRKVLEEPGWAFLPEELAILGDVAGQRACVLGSGDNLAVFALAGMGAEVTSVDISEAQIEVARGRAETLGLDVHFSCADVMEIDELADESYDLVHSSRHIACWVSDLRAFYRQAVRILKPGGLFFVTEYHPLRRIFNNGPQRLEVESSYLDRGPFRYRVSEELFDPKAGELEQFEYNWTIADFYAAMTEPGCTLITLDEIGDEAEDWEASNFSGLPQVILLAARKNVP